MSTSDVSSTVAVYGAVQEAKKIAAASKKGSQAASLAPIQAYDLYKVAREEELATYRGLCRVFVMHHGKVLPKSALRILEDLRESMCISDERGVLELEAAQGDALATGVEASGVLGRRGDFFDGVDDVELVDFAKHGSAGAVVGDDEHAVVVMGGGSPPTKAVRRENDTTASSSSGVVQGARGSQVGSIAARKSARTQLMNKINKAGAEAQDAAKELIRTADAGRRTALRALLEKKKSELTDLKEEAILME